MTTLKISKGNLPSEVFLPSSKSYANRMLILASLRSEEILLRGLPESTDVTFLVSALKKIGIGFEWQKNLLKVSDSFPRCESDGCEIDVGEGGTTARFLAGLLLLGKKPYTLILGDRLKERPWQEFIDFVTQHGGWADLRGNRLALQGPLNLPNVVEIDCARTTQFASAIQLAFSHKGIKVIPIKMESSQSYWEMTEDLIKTMQSGQNFNVPLDWSSASYPLAFGALNYPIFFPGLKFDSFQADAKFFHILKQFSAIEELQDGLRVLPVLHHQSVKVNVDDCLDLVPALAFFLAHIKGKHELVGIRNLVFKESDRLKEVKRLLDCFGRFNETVGDSLIIEGSPELMNQSVNLVLPDDHRMVMTGALFLLHHSGGVIGPAEAVKKSYPNFFDLFKPS
jgi:3-phosphoshikimate 1-carboxyvinyltransferase